ncbi:GntR family transcriptional regulator [Svornostia abyssi]|uniref:GntR family transcriptional regulator n=1 Tax=Svornostia abyssi TaxID=2898438 RepID=A0ABY5PI98_9ACTN|nr:GntR family transcriptional regulator [Parviterribacteraceae bacterium J379]
MNRPLPRVSAVEALVTVLRDRILEGELPAGERLVERELTERYDVARHTLRAALRALEAEGLVRIEPNRGARVAQLDADELRDLFALRLALEREAAHLALERHDGRLPAAVHDAAAQLARLAATRRTGWAGVAAAHNAVHRALVAAGGAPRITRAYAALDGELSLFTMQLRPVWTRDRLGPDHLELVAAIERDGPEVLRAHVDEALTALTTGP